MQAYLCPKYASTKNSADSSAVLERVVGLGQGRREARPSVPGERRSVVVEPVEVRSVVEPSEEPSSQRCSR